MRGLMGSRECRPSGDTNYVMAGPAHKAHPNVPFGPTRVRDRAGAGQFLGGLLDMADLDSDRELVAPAGPVNPHRRSSFPARGLKGRDTGQALNLGLKAALQQPLQVYSVTLVKCAFCDMETDMDGNPSVVSRAQPDRDVGQVHRNNSSSESYSRARVGMGGSFSGLSHGPEYS